MEQLEQNTSEENIISFLAYFNEIDKHFDKVLWEDGFSPYNEKIKKIAEWNYSDFSNQLIFTIGAHMDSRLGTCT